MQQTNQVFSLKSYLLAQLFCASATSLVALLVDSFIRELGVSIHPWKEALAAGLGGLFFATLLVPVLWKLRLFTLRQYLLGATILFVPTTLIVLVVVALFDSSLLNVFSEAAAEPNRGAIALAIYVRLARSVVLVPVYILVFYLVYHKWFKHPVGEHV